MSDSKHDVSLSEVHESVDTGKIKSRWKRLFAFLGPAYLVSVGYMDPGNWATDIAGGSRYGYTLIWVLLMSNIMAVLLQSLSARLGIVRGRDLAQASREEFSRPVNLSLYILAEIAIAACDLAEVLGMAIGIQLLFGLPLIYGVTITVLDTFLLLFLINHGIRKMEAFILGLIAIIGLAFLSEMIMARPAINEIITGFVPSIPDETALYIAIGIIGATVMPHNLYLHSSLVQTRKFDRSEQSIRKAIRYNMIDSVIALNLAFFVNAAILILAASTFFKNGMYEVQEIKDAHKFLQPLLGSEWAPRLFAIALIAAGQSSTITGTLAGQIIMEGYLKLRITPWLRRIITRVLAVVPALVTIYYLGEGSASKLLILSQVILSLQLGFAIIPLIHFVSDKEKMKQFAIPIPVQLFAWLIALIIVFLNGRMVYAQLMDCFTSGHLKGIWAVLVVGVVLGAGLLLSYIMIRPLIKRKRREAGELHIAPPESIKPFMVVDYKRIAIALDFSDTDRSSLNSAISQGGKSANYLLIHVVESAGALFMSNEIMDQESESDRNRLLSYAEELRLNGFNASISIGYGNPKKVLPTIVSDWKADLFVLGAHGHKGLKDLIFGTTVDAVRHRVKIPMLIVNQLAKSRE